MIFFISVLINADDLARLVSFLSGIYLGGIAQLVEHLLCKQGVIGSIPFISTMGKDGRPPSQTKKWAYSSAG